MGADCHSPLIIFLDFRYGEMARRKFAIFAVDFRRFAIAFLAIFTIIFRLFAILAINFSPFRRKWRKNVPQFFAILIIFPKNRWRNGNEPPAMFTIT